jgi:hypothetical protein
VAGPGPRLALPRFLRSSPSLSWVGYADGLRRGRLREEEKRSCCALPSPSPPPAPHPPDERASAVRPPVASDSSKPERPPPHPITFLSGPIRCLADSARLPPFSLPRPTTVRPPPDPGATLPRARRRSTGRRSSRYCASSSPPQLRCSLLTA